ncbi:DNA polymerase/3'-5' exonuclease PolX [candidate division KSB1 bacterium]|nr:MAG: DNA polymerase/3'-5' exonuclease PolX [candidate division KSB1 bacterium]
MSNREISSILEEIGTILELKGENIFKSRAYYNAARIIRYYPESIAEIVRKGKLSEIKGIGEALTKKITELVNTGSLKYYEKIKNSVPPGFLNMLKIPGLGPRKIKILYDKLNIASISELEYACKENRLLALQGFGKKSQDNILSGIKFLKKYYRKHLFNEAIIEAENVKEKLSSIKDIIRLEIVGSIRRKKELIRNINIVASSNDPEKIIRHIITTEGVKGGFTDGKSKIIYSYFFTDISIHLYVVPDDKFPYALYYYTGSSNHIKLMEKRAEKFNLKLNEDGIFRGDSLTVIKDENDVFQNLGLSYIPPELREGLDEIEIAEKGEIPELIKNEDIKGIFHIHTIYSDGSSSIPELIEVASKKGYEYIGIADHSKSAFYANGLTEEKINQQHKEIDNLNNKNNNFKVFKGIECDILPDGSLDYSDDILEGFDFVIAAVHTHFKMSERGMTKRVIRAMKNKFVTMLAHPTGRLLLGRERYSINMKKIIKAAKDYNVIIELNANPYRFDIDWRLLKYTKTKGVKIAINPDAHSLEGIYDVNYGVGIARKGWLESKDAINTYTLNEVQNLFKEMKK